MNALLIDRENRQKLQIAFFRLLSFGFRFEYFANVLLTYYLILNLLNICKILKPKPKTQKIENPKPLDFLSAYVSGKFFLTVEQF